jgi:hypothetical protein
MRDADCGLSLRRQIAKFPPVFDVFHAIIVLLAAGIKP